MPTYAYACTACAHRFEVQQSFTDAALTTCPECEGRLRKLFNSVGIVFKGSGFYRTDSRNGASGGEKASGKESGKESATSEPAAAKGSGSKESSGTAPAKEGSGSSASSGKPATSAA